MEYEQKFIVINVKRLHELNDVRPARDGAGEQVFSREHRANRHLIDAIEEWREAYKSDTGKKLDQKYYVVNQDEPYAEKVWELISQKPTN